MQLYIHIGKGKTGTTFLQNKVFNNISSINYIAKTHDNYPPWLINWHYADDIYFEKIKTNIQKSLHSTMSDKKINLISSEAFSVYGNIYQQAKRIKTIAPKSKIILTLRNPIDAIYSLYKSNVQLNGFTGRIEELIDWDRTPMLYYKRKPIYLPDFYYDEIINIYQELFGKENLLILKYEDMVSNSQLFFKQLESYFNISFNLQNVDKLLDIKINESQKEEFIIEQRVSNMYNKLKIEFPNSNISQEQIIDSNMTIFSKKLKDKIMIQLKGKCYGYY